MTHISFKKWNTILGWFAFLVAFITFGLTVESTVSFWDAGEYILTSAKLQVGHPPGAPLFQMFGAFFSMFALEPSQVGFMLNMMSAVASAFTILFMFFTITLLLRKLVGEAETLNKTQKIAILGSALVGSLAFTFTDSFWFNAVETEVYAMATLIMSVLFWLGLRWERDMDNPRGNRWLILIAFIIGLSFGVHFMGLLTIPAIGLIYYFKNYKTVTIKNFIIANVVSIAILLFIFKLLAPNILRIFSATEIFFVNSFGLPFHSGTIFASIALIALVYFGLKYTHNKNYKHLNTGLLCITFVIIGFSSWLMLPIRANADVVINENDPSDARELLAYYNLEQYPETHLFYGPQFTDQYSGLDENEPYIDDKPNYEKDLKTGKYVIINDWEKARQNYNSEHASILPRMWSGENAENYMIFTGYLDFKLKPEYQMDNELRAAVNNFKNEIANGMVDYEDYHKFLSQNSQIIDVEKPSLGSNVAYMLEYQLGYMYWRYFMWNFVGRQNDVQGKLDDFNGNWLSGIGFIDEWHLGLPQTDLPSDVKNNKARNTYFFLPFILGLIGLFFLYNKDKKLFWVMLVFFLFTGLAIQVYTNVRPFEPRERDYSLVGSFYVFALWIGFGVYAIVDMLKTKIKSKALAPAVTILCLILVPGILAANNWDDHDRSDKYTARAMAKMYLDSCEENGILFSIGDNDTFALWYAQEIEGYRTDVRVVNTSLFQTDWYIDQMKRKAYDSDPIPSTLTHEQYRSGTRDYVPKQIEYRDAQGRLQPVMNKDTLLIKDFMDFVSSDNPKTKMSYILQMRGEDPSYYPIQYQKSNYFPVENIRVPVNKENVLKYGIVKEKDADKIEDYVDIRITDGAIYKNRLLMLDIIATNDWKRPIYFTGGAFGNDDYIWMKDYLQLDGMVYKLVPIKTPVNRANPFDMGRVDSDFMYNKVKNWDWGNSGSPDIYHDVETRKNSITYRGNLARLIEQLINEDQPEKAEEIADIAMDNMPVDYFGYYTLLEPYISAYYEVDSQEKARKLFMDVAEKYQENLTYYSKLDEEQQRYVFEKIYTDIERYKSIVDVVITYDKEFAKTETKTFSNFLNLFSHFYGGDDVPDVEPEIEERPEPIDVDMLQSDTISIAPEE
ncbi:protein O-mannosyl-transferase family [Bizionia sp.]|uniref:protein O-mannosyl-transferase family n=1 Tax=Bizionia sp. TaxID=1954480 RepID=UPI003A8DBD5D